MRIARRLVNLICTKASHNNIVLTTTVVGVSLVDTGPPRPSPLGIWVGVAGRVLWQWRGFVGMLLVHPNGNARPWVPWCGYSVLPLQSV